MPTKLPSPAVVRRTGGRAKYCGAKVHGQQSVSILVTHHLTVSRRAFPGRWALPKKRACIGHQSSLLSTYLDIAECNGRVATNAQETRGAAERCRHQVPKKFLRLPKNLRPVTEGTDLLRAQCPPACPAWGWGRCAADAGFVCASRRLQRSGDAHCRRDCFGRLMPGATGTADYNW
jgi:hypothetical protein